MTTQNRDTADTTTWSDDALLRRYFATREVNCPLCDHRLYALAVTRCPRCKSELILDVAPRDPAIGSWIVLVVNLFAAAGLGVLFLVVTFLEGMPPWRTWTDRLLSTTLYCFIAMIPVSVVALLARRWFGCLAPTVRRVIAGAAVFLTVAAYIGFMLAWLVL